MTSPDKSTLAAFIENAHAEIAVLDNRIADAESALRELRAERQGVQREFKAFRSAYERMFNEAAPFGDDPDEGPDLFGFNGRDGVYIFESKSPVRPAIDLDLIDEKAEEDDWSKYGRSAAVHMAVVSLLNAGQKYASPADIEALLHEKGREGDTRDYIGAALAYLNRSGQVANVGRGQWVLADSGEDMA